MVVVTAANQIPKLRVTGAKLYVPVVTLSTQNNAKLLKKVESAFKKAINWNEYLCNKSNAKQTFKYFNWCKYWRSKQTFFII